MNPGMVKAILGLVESLVRPLMIALGLWKVKRAGRTEAEKEQLEDELDAVDDARAAESASRNQRVRDEIDAWRDR
jgi:cytochrome oxidase assembly protein ShyY1